MMKVSIITVCFDSVRTIRDTIESVLAQNYPYIEYIVIDGGSSDGTLEILDEYKDKIDILITEPDKGIYDAMNKGISVATGEVIATLNSDDFYFDQLAVQKLVNCMSETSSDVVFADLVYIDSQNIDKIVRYYRANNFHPKKLKYGWMPPHPTFFAKRILFDKFGFYSLDFRIAADFEMMVRLLYKAKVSYMHLPEVIVKMRAGGVSTGGFRNSWLLNNEIVKACRMNGLNTNLFFVLLKIPAKLYEYISRPQQIKKAPE